MRPEPKQKPSVDISKNYDYIRIYEYRDQVIMASETPKHTDKFKIKSIIFNEILRPQYPDEYMR